MRVLADHGVEGHFESSRVIVAPFGWQHARLFRLPLLRALPMVAYAMRCWWVGLRTPEPGPFVTVGSAHAFVLAFLQLLARPFVRPRTHVLFDLLLERRRGGLAGVFDRLKSAVFRAGIDAAVVWGKADIALYAEEHGLPPERLHFQPFHITLESYDFEIQDEGFIFAGGNHGRDYATVIEALGPIDYPVFIATQKEGVRELAEAHPHIEVRAVTPAEFRRRMAASTLVVEAHPKEFFRTAGHQTFLNAMWLGKPFVMADRKSAEGYFEDGRHWFVVDHGDVEGLRSRVRLLLEDRERREAMAREARAEVGRPRYRTLGCMQEIYNLAVGIEARKRGIDLQDVLIDVY